MEPATTGKRAVSAAPWTLAAAPWRAATDATLAPRRWLLWAPVALGLGVQGYFSAPVEPSVAQLWIAAALALCAAGAMALALRRGASLAAGAALALALAAAGFAWTGAQARAVAAPVLAAPLTALVEGRVRAVSQSASGRPRLLLDDVRIWSVAAAATPARVRVTLGRGDDPADYASGQRVSVMARLRPPSAAPEPDGFDFARFAWFQRLGAVGIADGRVAMLGAAQPAGLLETLRLRQDLARAALSRALREAMPAESGAFAAALATGDRTALPPDAVQALRDSGLAHLLAISGLHMAMVCGLAFAAARLSITALPGLGLRWRAKAVAAGVALVVGALYLGLSGGSVATQRAFVMAMVALVAVLATRPAVTVRALAAAALAVLILAPHSLISVGFQMSFAATLALVSAYETARARGWLRLTSSVPARLLRYAVALVATSLIAGLATAPFAAFHFNRVATLGLVANLAAVPVMGLAVAPGLLGAAVLAPLGLEAAPLWLADRGIAWILWVARSVAAAPGAAALLATPHPAALWCVTLGGLALCLGRGAARLLGLAPLAAAVALWGHAGAMRPTLLIAPGATAVGAVADGVRHVDADREGWFAAQTWRRRDGRAQEAPAFRRDGDWRVAALDGGRSVWLFRGDRAPRPSVADRCAFGRIVIAPALRVGAPPFPCVVVDAATLAAGGALSIRAAGDGAALRSASSGRLWSARPGP